MNIEQEKGDEDEKRPLREPVSESVTMDGVPSRELRDKPVETEPELR